MITIPKDLKYKIDGIIERFIKYRKCVASLDDEIEQAGIQLKTMAQMAEKWTKLRIDGACDIESNALNDYADSLSYEDLLLIITIMYIGRDFLDIDIHAANNDDFELTIDIPVFDMNYFNDEYEHLKATLRTKDAVKDQMFSKAPLAEYLKRGKEIYDKYL